MRILIADDHAIIRDGLRRLLEAEPDFQVVGEAEDGAEAVRLAAELEPDILLIDLAMPRLSGLEALRDIAAAEGRPRIILLTAAIDRSEIALTLLATSTPWLVSPIECPERPTRCRSVAIRFGKNGNSRKNNKEKAEAEPANAFQPDRPAERVLCRL